MFAITIPGKIYTTLSSSIPGTYAQGTFPLGGNVSITKDCTGDKCVMVGNEQDMVYYFNGISTSPDTFVPVSSSYAFNSPMAYNSSLSGANGKYPFVYYHPLTTTQRNLINALTPGTYYVWYNNTRNGTLTITSSVFTASFTTHRNFVFTDKLGNNPIISQLTWVNPTASNIYYYAALGTSSSPAGGVVYGFYGPYTMTNGRNGTVNTYIHYNALAPLADNSNLYLIS